MDWYTINDPKCQFKQEGNKILGTVGGRVYELTDAGFKPVSLRKNPYMPDEISDSIYAHARMLPHHIAYAKEKARRLKKKVFKRNPAFIPSEVKEIFSAHAKMLPHHVAYARGRFGKMSSLED